MNYMTWPDSACSQHHRQLPTAGIAWLLFQTMLFWTVLLKLPPDVNDAAAAVLLMMMQEAEQAPEVHVALDAPAVLQLAAKLADLDVAPGRAALL